MLNCILPISPPLLYVYRQSVVHKFGFVCLFMFQYVTLMQLYEGDTPSPFAYCIYRPNLAVRTAYRHVLALHIAYRSTTKKQHFFCVSIYKKKDQMSMLQKQYVAYTCTVILANVSFDVCLLDFLVFDP